MQPMTINPIIILIIIIFLLIIYIIRLKRDRNFYKNEVEFLSLSFNHIMAFIYNEKLVEKYYAYLKKTKIDVNKKDGNEWKRLSLKTESR